MRKTDKNVPVENDRESENKFFVKILWLDCAFKIHRSQKNYKNKKKKTKFREKP